MLSFTHKCVAIISWSSDIWHNNTEQPMTELERRMNEKKKISKITFNNWIHFDDDEKQMIAQANGFEECGKNGWNFSTIRQHDLIWFFFFLKMSASDLLCRSGFYLSSFCLFVAVGRLHFILWLLSHYRVFSGWCIFFQMESINLFGQKRIIINPLINMFVNIECEK